MCFRKSIALRFSVGRELGSYEKMFYAASKAGTYVTAVTSLN